MPGRTLALVLTIVGMSGCSYQGLNSLPLPGTQGRGADSYQVNAEFADMSGMQPNGKVMVDNVDVGTVTHVAVQGWHAVATLRLNRNVVLPANVTAKIGQVSLLGSKYVELAPPATPAQVGRLKNGDTIPLAQSGSYPETEDVLSAASLLLNGGGLAQINTITTQLNSALGGGRADQIRQALEEVDTFATRLEQSKGSILAAIDGLDRLASQAANQNRLIGDTLQDMPPALTALNDERPALTNALNSLSAFSDSATQVLNDSRGPLVDNLKNLEPTLRALADAKDSLVHALGVLGTGPFPLKTWRGFVEGDYGKIWLTLDLTNSAINRYYLPLLKGASPNLAAGPQSQANDPLKAPLEPSQQPNAGTPAPPSQSPPPSNGNSLGGLLGGLGGGQ